MSRLPTRGWPVSRGRLRFLSKYFLDLEAPEELVHGMLLFRELYDDTIVGGVAGNQGREQVRSASDRSRRRWAPIAFPEEGFVKSLTRLGHVYLRNEFIVGADQGDGVLHLQDVLHEPEEVVAIQSSIDDVAVVVAIATPRRSSDPSTTGALLYNLKLNAEVAAARHGVPDAAQNDERSVAVPLPVIETLYSELRAQLGPARGERLVLAVDDYLAAHPKLTAVLQTPGVTSQLEFRRVLDAVFDHVRVQQRI